MEISYDQFPNLALYVQSIAAEHSDPLEILEATEDELINLYSRNIHGETVMNQTTQAFAKAVNAETKTHRVHAYPDLLEAIKDKVHQPQLLHRTLSSMAWMMDVMAINNARSVFYEMYRDAQKRGLVNCYDDYKDNFQTMYGKLINGATRTIDSRNDIETYIKSTLESIDGGVDDSANTARKLLSLSRDWHDAARASAALAGRNYTQRTLAELLRNEKPQGIPTLTRQKIEALAKDAADGDEELEKAAVEQTLQKQQAAKRDQFIDHVNTIVYIEMILDEVQRSLPEVTHFHELERETQARLVAYAPNAIDRALNDLTNDRRIAPTEFIGIIKEARAAMKEIKDLYAEQFADLS